MFFSQTPGRRPPYITGLRVNSVTLRWVRVPNERAPLRVHDAITVFAARCLTRTRIADQAFGGFHEHCAGFARATKFRVSCPGQFIFFPWWCLLCLFVSLFLFLFCLSDHRRGCASFRIFVACRLGFGVSMLSPLRSSFAIRHIFRGICFPHFSLYFRYFVLILCFVFPAFNASVDCWHAYVAPVASSTMACYCIVYLLSLRHFDVVVSVVSSCELPQVGQRKGRKAGRRAVRRPTERS